MYDARRIGQQRPVTIYRLVTRSAIEERIADLHRHKRDLADSLLGASDMSGKMSADELLRLLKDGWTRGRRLAPGKTIRYTVPC